MNNQKSLHERWINFLEKSFNITIPVIAILAAFLVSGFIILIWGSNPLDAYAALFSGAFGSPNAIATTLVRGTPLLFTGLAVAYGYRGGFFNIGAEGQLYLGAYAATWMGATLTDLPGFILIPICIVSSMLAGALYALLPGYLKASRGINEVLTTLLMNYIGIQFTEWIMRVDHVTQGVTHDLEGEPILWNWVNWIGLKDPTQPFPKSPFTVEAAYLPSLQKFAQGDFMTGLFAQTGWHQAILSHPAFNRITLAPIIGLLAAAGVYFILFKTTTGYKSRAVGINQQAARSMGVDLRKTILTTALISGALGGLAGGIEVLGNQHRIIPNFLVNAGFDGIPVALIGQLHPFGVILSAFFFGALRAGANKMQILSHVPVAVVYVIEALAILFAIAGTTFDVESSLKKRRLMRKRKTPKTGAHSNQEEVSHA